jgi:outer membrane protein insertion porin family
MQFLGIDKPALSASDRISFQDLRYSAGLGISWISPVGPLKLSLARPMNPASFDRTQAFQFQLGTGF